MTQRQLGDLIGVRFQQIAKYESGDNQIAAGRLWQIASALGVPVSYFYEGLNGVAAGAHAEPEREPEAESSDLVRIYRGLDDHARRELLALAKLLRTSA